MKTALIISGVVTEIIPEYALPVDKFYGKEFAQKCMEIEDEVEVGWIYEESQGIFVKPNNVEKIREKKENEISDACNEAIIAGMDVETTNGTEHFSLQETDQINLTTAYNAILSGAKQYPYHADGQLCRMFTAEEITNISNASIQHKLYHTTLCNHLLTWVRRSETEEEISSITYSAEGMPEDLAENMAKIMAASQNV